MSDSLKQIIISTSSLIKPFLCSCHFHTVNLNLYNMCKVHKAGIKFMKVPQIKKAYVF